MDEGDCGEVEGRGKQTGLRSRCERAPLLSLREWAPLVLRMTSVLRLGDVGGEFLILQIQIISSFSTFPPQECCHVGRRQCGSEDVSFLFGLAGGKCKT